MRGLFGALKLNFFFEKKVFLCDPGKTPSIFEVKNEIKNFAPPLIKFFPFINCGCPLFSYELHLRNPKVGMFSLLNQFKLNLQLHNHWNSEIWLFANKNNLFSFRRWKSRSRILWKKYQLVLGPGEIKQKSNKFTYKLLKQ